jgi:hypothetical protein
LLRGRALVSDGDRPRGVEEARAALLLNPDNIIAKRFLLDITGDQEELARIAAGNAPGGTPDKGLPPIPIIGRRATIVSTGATGPLAQSPNSSAKPKGGSRASQRK